MENFDEKDFEELKQQIKNNENGIISATIKEINYEINLSKPIRVVLKDGKNEIEFYSGKIASSKIQVDRIENRAHYRKKNSLNLGVTLIRVVNVIESEINNKHYISEKYLIREQFDENMIAKKSDKIIEDIVSNDTSLKKNGEGSFVKKPIESDEEFNKIIHPEEELDKYLVEGSKTKLGNFPSGFYEDRHDYEFNKKNKQIKSYDECINKADELLEEYKNLNIRITEIIKEENAVEEEKEVEVEADTDTENEIEEKNTELTNEKILVEEENTIEEPQIEENTEEIVVEDNTNNDSTENNEEGFDISDEQISELEEELKKRNSKSKEENDKKEEPKASETSNDGEETSDLIIDEVVAELDRKRREKEQAAIRNNKINKVKELINLNKQLDEELEEIENSKNGEGVANE